MERKPVRIEIEYEDGTINRCTAPKRVDNDRKAFAIAAMQGLLSKDIPVPVFVNDYTQLAAKAVLCADALLSALSTPPSSSDFNAQTPQVVYVNYRHYGSISVSLTPREGYVKVEVEK
jgi:hypothetical protein